MLDCKAAYHPELPQGPGKCLGTALLDIEGTLTEVHVFGRWLEGCRWRYNLIQFGQGTFLRVWRGKPEEQVIIQ